jgi:hypothetical protein
MPITISYNILFDMSERQARVSEREQCDAGCEVHNTMAHLEMKMANEKLDIGNCFLLLSSRSTLTHSHTRIARR